MAEFDIEQQEVYYADTLIKLGNAPATDMRWLPGMEGDTDGVNTFILGMEPLSDFDLVGHSGNFKDRFGGAPHMVALLGMYTVLAMVEIKGLPADREGYHGQRLVALNYNGPEQIRAIPPGERASINLERPWLAGNTGFDDPGINPLHAILANHGASWTVHDLRSNNGTFVAVEGKTGRPGYGSRPDDDTDIIAAISLEDLDRATSPSVHASMQIRALTRHRLGENPRGDS